MLRVLKAWRLMVGEFELLILILAKFSGYHDELEHSHRLLFPSSIIHIEKPHSLTTPDLEITLPNSQNPNFPPTPQKHSQSQENNQMPIAHHHPKIHNPTMLALRRCSWPFLLLARGAD